MSKNHFVNGMSKSTAGFDNGINSNGLLYQGFSASTSAIAFFGPSISSRRSVKGSGHSMIHAGAVQKA
jgi:hypothetical protein